MLFYKKTYNFGVKWRADRLHLTVFSHCHNKRVFYRNNFIRTGCNFGSFSCLLISQSTWSLSNSQTRLINIMLIPLRHTLRDGLLFQSSIECKVCHSQSYGSQINKLSFRTMKFSLTSNPGLSARVTLGKSSIFFNVISFSCRNYSSSKILSFPIISMSLQGKSHLLMNHLGPQWLFMLIW